MAKRIKSKLNKNLVTKTQLRVVANGRVFSPGSSVPMTVSKPWNQVVLSLKEISFGPTVYGDQYLLSRQLNEQCGINVTNPVEFRLQKISIWRNDVDLNGDMCVRIFDPDSARPLTVLRDNPSPLTMAAVGYEYPASSRNFSVVSGASAPSIPIFEAADVSTADTYMCTVHVQVLWRVLDTDPERKRSPIV